MTMRAIHTDSDRWFLKPAVVAGAGLLAVVVAIVINLLQPREAEQTPGSAPATTVAPAVPTEAPPSLAAAPLPSFDVVRINPQGDAVVAGRAEPGAKVVLRDGERTLGEATADSRGEWVFVPETPLPPGSHRLDLEMRVGSAPPVRSTEEVLVVVPEPGKDIAGRPAGNASQPLALRIPRSGGPASVLQKPSAGGGTELAIDAVDYDAQGRIALSGRAPPSSRVRLAIDGKPTGEAVADAAGQWRIIPERAVSGDLHTLLIDQIDAKGKVIASTAVPFALAAGGSRSPGTGGIGTGNLGAGDIVVQPGENLWRIARSAYGRGNLYTIIYEANRGRISHPDRIFPGQVFQLPPPAPASPTP